MDEGCQFLRFCKQIGPFHQTDWSHYVHTYIVSIWQLKLNIYISLTVIGTWEECMHVLWPIVLDLHVSILVAEPMVI
jgi:hypothetical protein